VKPRFQADNDLRSAIRTGVLRREPSIDFRSAHAAGLEGVPDPEVLRRCAEHGRILASHDENSMPGHFRDFLAAGHVIPRVFIVPQDAAIGAVIASILLVWIASESEEWRNRLVWLPL
jgi:Domain of unknown function (DUF5615)